MDVRFVRNSVQEALARVREHPFIVEAHAGDLARDQAVRWIFCAGRESRTFPELLRRLVDNAQNPTVKAILHQNLEDELGQGDPNNAHFQHYLQLLGQLGISCQEFDTYSGRAGLALALSLARNVADSSREALAIGYMMINEAITPVSYGAAHVALGRFFHDLNPEFFEIHVDIDERHLEDLYRAAAALGDGVAEDLLFGVRLGERGMEALLDEAYGVFDYCPEAEREEVRRQA